MALFTGNVSVQADYY